MTPEQKAEGTREKRLSGPLPNRNRRSEAYGCDGDGGRDLPGTPTRCVTRGRDKGKMEAVRVVPGCAEVQAADKSGGYQCDYSERDWNRVSHERRVRRGYA